MVFEKKTRPSVRQRNFDERAGLLQSNTPRHKSVCTAVPGLENDHGWHQRAPSTG